MKVVSFLVLVLYPPSHQWSPTARILWCYNYANVMYAQEIAIVITTPITPNKIVTI
jgi:hypothetical protein